MAFATIQAQLAQLTAQLSQNAERATMPSVPTFGASYGQGYQNHQCPQFSANEDVWGYQGHSQSRGNIFSNAYNSNWIDQSDYMWEEPQQVQQSGYWQQDEAFYSEPMQPPQPPLQSFQSNSSMPIDYNQILNELNSLVQGSQNQAKETHQREYWQPYADSCAPPQPPPQPLPQPSHPNYYKEVIQQLNSLEQGREAQPFQQNAFWQPIEEFYQAKELAEQIREQMVEDEPMDELLPQKEDEEDDLGSLDEFLSQTPQVPMSSNLGEEVPSSIHSNPIPPYVPFSCRFLNPKEEVNEKDVVETLPEAQSESPILGAPNHVPDDVETFKEPCTPRRGIQSNEVAGEFQEYIKEAVHETIEPKEVEFDNKGQVTIITCNLAKFKVPETFENVVFVIEFERESKPSSPFLILFYSNNLILMMQAPSLELRPWPEHFKYHRPFSDKSMHLNKEGRPRNHPQSDLHS